MSTVSRTIAFAAQLYGQRAATAYAGYVKRDPLSRLALRPGRADPYAIYEQLRARGTLVPTRRGNWASTSHRVCDSVLRDRRFSVRREDTAPVGLHPAGTDPPGAIPAGTEPPGAIPAATGSAATGPAATGSGDDDFNLSFLEMDPPDHTRLRRLAAPAFSPKAVAAYSGRIERTVAALLDKAARDREFDLVSEFAAPLPIAVITDLLGIPDAATADFVKYGLVIGSALDGIRSLRHAARLQAADGALRKLFTDLFELRRREPADDVISHLVAAEGDQVKPGEMVPMCTLLLIAGFETTVNLIGNGVLALLAHRDQWEALRADPDRLAPKAVEEILRYDSPVQVTSRVASEQLDLDGKTVRKGQIVVTLIGGANRDPRVYDRPAAFDIERENPAPHLAFSGGIHYCLGQPLARLEGEIAFRMLAERLAGLRLAGRIKRRDGVTIRGPLRLPVAA